MDALLGKLKEFGEEETFATLSAIGAYLCCPPDKYEP